MPKILLRDIVGRRKLQWHSRLHPVWKIISTGSVTEKLCRRGCAFRRHLADHGPTSILTFFPGAFGDTLPAAYCDCVCHLFPSVCTEKVWKREIGPRYPCLWTTKEVSTLISIVIVPVLSINEASSHYFLQSLPVTLRHSDNKPFSSQAPLCPRGSVVSLTF